MLQKSLALSLLAFSLMSFSSVSSASASVSASETSLSTASVSGKVGKSSRDDPRCKRRGGGWCGVFI